MGSIVRFDLRQRIVLRLLPLKTYSSLRFCSMVIVTPFLVGLSPFFNLLYNW